MPESRMQKLLLNSLILIVAISSIACACPSDSLKADSPAHAGHDMHLDHAKPASPDCCGAYNEAVAMQCEMPPAKSGLRFHSEDFGEEPVWTPVAINTDWSSGVPPPFLPTGPDNTLPPQSPVIRNDRMLD